MIELGPGAFACGVCGAVYPDSAQAQTCESFPVEPETVQPGTMIRVGNASAHAGPGLVSTSFVLGLDDPRGEAHTRYYRASFLWGRADFRLDEFEVVGPATHQEWREAVEREVGESQS